MFALAVIASLCLTSRCRAEAVLLQGCVCAGSGRLLPDHPTWFWFPNSCKYTASYFVTQCENALSLATLFYPRALHRSSEAHGSNRIALGQVLPGRSKEPQPKAADVAMQQDCRAAQVLASCSCLKITQQGARHWLLSWGALSFFQYFSPSKSESTSPSFFSFSSSFCLLTHSA